ncbi:hypothetical protein LguiB_019468 [Lonicera macranthoides]
MAKSTLMGYCAFIVVLLLCHEIVGVEGRHLKSSTTTRVCKKCSKNTHNNKITNMQATKLSGFTAASTSINTRDFPISRERNLKAQVVEDFRPTAPGHSPGVEERSETLGTVFSSGFSSVHGGRRRSASIIAGIGEQTR